MAPRMLPPGSIIGILGGGQLGRMTALAAANLGYRSHVFTPEPDAPAAQVTPHVTVAAWDDAPALAAFAAAVDVVTLEWENVPLATLDMLSRQVSVHPGARVLAVSQDRIEEKSFLNGIGIETAPWLPVRQPGELEDALARIGLPAVLKTTRLGYDGKGQATIRAIGDMAAAQAVIGGREAILEGFVAFERELSVIVARGQDGAIATYPVVENRHRHHILHETIAPAEVAPELAEAADRMARRVAESLDLVGVLAIEMFVTPDGRLLANELAPRPHNSGHWTIDATACSQFEQLVRAVCGLPLGDTRPLAPAVMTNLIGDDVDAWPSLLAEPGAKLHLYGKAEARPGRKMGHVTRLRPRG